MGFPAARTSESENILPSIKERSFPQNGYLMDQLSSEPGKIKVVEAFFQRHIGLAEPPCNTLLAPLGTFEFQKFPQERLVVRLFRKGLGGLLFKVVPDRGQVKLDRKSTRLNSSHVRISYAVFCLK